MFINNNYRNKKQKKKIIKKTKKLNVNYYNVIKLKTQNKFIVIDCICIC